MHFSITLRARSSAMVLDHSAAVVGINPTVPSLSLICSHDPAIPITRTYFLMCTFPTVALLESGLANTGDSWVSLKSLGGLIGLTFGGAAVTLVVGGGGGAARGGR